MANRKIFQLNNPGQTGTPTLATQSFFLAIMKPDGLEEPVKITVSQLKVLQAYVAGDIGLGSVNNTSDINKPVSTPQQAALDLKANLASPTFTGTVGGITKTMVGLGAVDNTSDVNKPVSTAQSAATTAAINALKDGVPVAGDTLNKLYNFILAQTKEVTVATIAARDALNITSLPTNVFVTDDGDTRWALYKATTTGAPATYIKISDPDLLNAVMSASAIKVSYESNADTNAFTNAYKAQVDLVAGKANIASPTFTGTPAAPTAVAGTNTTQLATTAFVKAAVDAAQIYFDNAQFGGLGTQASPITNIGGGGGSSFPTQQVHTTGATVAVNNSAANIWLLVNPTATLATLNATLPPAPLNGQEVTISAGGTLESGEVITALTVTPNTGHTLLQPSPGPSVVRAGEALKYRFSTVNAKWYRI